MIPPSLEIDLARMFEVVFGARWTTLAPVSLWTPLPATPLYKRLEVAGRLGVEVVDVLGPVLDRRVARLCALVNEDLDDRGVH